MSVWDHSSIAEPEDRRGAPDDRRELTRERPGRRTTDRERTPKAVCPHCRHGMSHVISDWDYRPHYDDDARAYVRYRRCDGCRGIFWTEETVGGACFPKR
jgi:uncharacterized protein with PIN domain